MPSHTNRQRERDIEAITRLLKHRSDRVITIIRYRLEQYQQQHPPPLSDRERLNSILNGLDDHFIKCYADELEQLHGDRGWRARNGKKEPLRLVRN